VNEPVALEWAEQRSRGLLEREDDQRGARLLKLALQVGSAVGELARVQLRRARRRPLAYIREATPYGERGVAVAMSITAAIGDFSRFGSPDKLVRYLGFNPRVKQSGGQPASHGRITKQGRAHARGMLVEVRDRFREPIARLRVRVGVEDRPNQRRQ